MAAILYILFVLLAFLGAPLFSVLGAFAVSAFKSAGISLEAVPIEMWRLADAPALSAIPLFTFAGYLLAESNAPMRLVRFYKACLGFVPGGIAVASVILSAFFTVCTGASGVTIIALGGLLFPILLKEGYDERFSLGLVTTGGGLGVLGFMLIPSLPLILYGIIGSVSVDRLIYAGFLPSMLILLIISLYAMVVGRGIEREEARFDIREVWKGFLDAAWELAIPVVIFVGLVSGIATVSEVAVIVVIYALLVEALIKKEIDIRGLVRITMDSMQVVGGILLVLASAIAVTGYLIDQRVPMRLFELVSPHITNKYLFLVILNLFLLIVGCMMDIFSAIVVVAPMIIPIATAFGVDPVHLGVIFLANLEIGYSTPPVGLNLFLASYRFKRPIGEVYIASIPYLCLLLFALILITYLPFLSLFLPGRLAH